MLSRSLAAFGVIRQHPFHLGGDGDTPVIVPPGPLGFEDSGALIFAPQHITKHKLTVRILFLIFYDAIVHTKRNRIHIAKSKNRRTFWKQRKHYI